MKMILTLVLLAVFTSAPSFLAAKRITHTNSSRFKSSVDPFTFNQNNRVYGFNNSSDNKLWTIHVFVNKYTSSNVLADKVIFSCNNKSVAVFPGQQWSTCELHPNGSASIRIDDKDFHVGAEGVVQLDKFQRHRTCLR
tara:strand:- start:227 stop:640 length:414 start_codon:yes stop_codon:yes gene_type:complete